MRQLRNDAAWQSVDPWPLTAMTATAEMIIEDFPVGSCTPVPPACAQPDTGARPAALHGRSAVTVPVKVFGPVEVKSATSAFAG